MNMMEKQKYKLGEISKTEENVIKNIVMCDEDHKKCELYCDGKPKNVIHLGCARFSSCDECLRKNLLESVPKCYACGVVDVLEADFLVVAM